MKLFLILDYIMLSAMLINDDRTDNYIYSVSHSVLRDGVSSV